MGTQIAHCSRQDVTALAEDLKVQLSGFSPAFILFFASSGYEPTALGEALANAFGRARSLGCTTAGEIISGHMLKNSVVLMAMDGDTVAKVATAPVVTPRGEDSVAEALDTVRSAVLGDAGRADPARHLGLVLHDGLNMTEEAVMSTLTTRTNVPFVGGSAGDDLDFKATHVFVDFEPRQASSVLAMLELRRPFAILKSQSFDVLDTVLEVTDVDEATRTMKDLTTDGTFQGTVVEYVVDDVGGNSRLRVKMIPEVQGMAANLLRVGFARKKMLESMSHTWSQNLARLSSLLRQA